MSAVGSQWGEGRFTVQDGDWGGEEIVHDPSAHSVPKGVHQFEGAAVWGQEVGAVGQDWEE